MSYGQTGEFDAAMRKLDNTKPVNVRDPFFTEGVHDEVVVVELQPFLHDTHGPSARCTFEVIRSSVATPGSRFVKLWNLTKPSKFASQTNDADRFSDFIQKLSGTQGAVGHICAAVLRDRVGDNLLCGMRIKATGVNTSKKADKPYVDVRWDTIVQTPEQIQTWRARLTANAAAAPAQAAPQPAPAPAPQPQYAPPPAQWAPPAAPAAAPSTGSTLLSQIPGFGGK